MLKIEGTRGAGKTTQLLHFVAGKEVVFVCCSPRIIEEKIRALNISGCEKIRFISYRDFYESKYNKKIPIVIDDIDCLCSYIKKCVYETENIVGYTETIGEE